MEKTELNIKLFDPIIRNLRITLKNSVFYASDHPINVYSINNFKTSLDKWFGLKNQFNLGFSQDQLYIDGKLIDNKDDCYSEVANYLHTRGLSSLTILQGIQIDELKTFFTFIGQDRKTIREKGGILKNISNSNHLRLKELDYSSLLERASQKVVSEEEKIWKFLFDIVEESKTGKLPNSKMEFLVDFFADEKKSASTLNKVYREAVNHLQDENTVKDIRSTITKICEYFDQYSSDNVKDLKVKLMNVIAQLHPDLINILFEQTVDTDQEFDLAEAITKDFSESYIAEFIESLISNEDTFNENLLKVFDKLAPDSSKSDNMVMMVADKLFSKRIVNPETLSKLQMSIMEIFKKHPDSNFMKQIYNITVDAVINKKVDTLVYVARLTPLINKFVQSMEDEELKKEKLWLLLNILWLENKPEDFKKFTDKVVSILPELLDSKDTERIKEIVEFYTEKTRPEQRKNNKIISEIKEGIEKITSKETVDSIIALIPEASKMDLDNITYILLKSEYESAKSLVDAYIVNKNPAHRNKFRYIFLQMREKIATEVVDRLEYCEPVVVRDLLNILKESAPEKAHLVTKKLMSHKNAQVRWVALEKFEPGTEIERTDVFKIFKKEKNKEVKKKAASLLLKTKNPEIIKKLFDYTSRNIFHHKFLIQLVELCGHVRAQESLLHLKKIYQKKALFNSKRRDDLRVATVTSLSRLQIDEATELVRSGFHDKSKRVKERVEIIIKLNENMKLQTR